MSRLRKLSNPPPGSTSIRRRGTLWLMGDITGQLQISPNGYLLLPSPSTDRTAKTAVKRSRAPTRGAHSKAIGRMLTLLLLIVIRCGTVVASRSVDLKNSTASVFPHRIEGGVNWGSLVPRLPRFSAGAEEGLGTRLYCKASTN